MPSAHARFPAADESLYLHRPGGVWRCERWSNARGFESIPLAESDVPPMPPVDGIDSRLVAAVPTERDIRSAVRMTLKTGRHAWIWLLCRRAGEPFTEAETAAAAARFSEIGPALALRDAVRDGDAVRDEMDLILQNSVDAIIVVDAENKIRLFNGAASDIFGYKASEALGMDYDMLLPPEMRGKGEAERIRRLVEQKLASRDEECLRWSKDGKPLALKVAWAAIKRPEGTLVSHISFIRDMRPIKRLREELVRAQSLAIVGELAASVAHEVRNPLASIQAALENLRAELKPAGGHDEMFRKILDQIGRLDDTVESLLIFSKPWEVHPREYDLASVIQASTTAVSREPDCGNARFEVSCPVPCLLVGDPELVDHVLVNVLRNAAQAMTSGGRVEVRATLADTLVEIAVRDGGPGVPPENQTKVFRPFFTTKTRGTGLGLATCQKMVQAHRGTIRISNVAGGRGAEVCVKLPRIYR